MMEKRALREAMGLRRAAAHALGQGEAGAHLGRVLADHAQGAVVAGYMPMRSEIDPLPAMAAFAGRLALPVVLGPAQPLGFRAWAPGDRLIPGGFGTEVPAQGDWLQPDVLIVPLLAFDARGYRLGYGGGFYDRTLEALAKAGRRVLAVGFAYAAQEVETVPTEPTDLPLDLIVTDRGVLRPGPGAAI